ncbi:MAG: hypothetical protein ABGX42_01370 [Gammaproteobacteria bacterium]
MSQTETNHSELEIKHILDELVPKIQTKVNLNYQRYKSPNQIVGKSFLSELKPPILTIQEGRIYYKLILESTSDFGGNSATVYGFIRRKDGAIFRAATWKQPETRTKTAIRGHITDEYCIDYFTPHGVTYAI